MVGLIWSCQIASNYMATITPYFDQTISVVGKVISVNIYDKEDNEYIPPVHFQVYKINSNPLTEPFNIVLRWQDSNVPESGQIWSLDIKTKAIHSYLNEGGFDSQRFAIANRLAIFGSVKNAELINGEINLRQHIINRVKPVFELFTYGDVMYALTFGERGRLTKEHKELFFETGIAHLLAISGMHILLVYVFVYNLVKKLLYFLPIKFLNQWIPLFIALFCALFYAWLSGFKPPALRASFALIIWLFIKLKHKNLSSWQVINRIIAILLFIDPLMILSDSFWLSCYAVVTLIFISQWMPRIKPIKSKILNYLWQLMCLQMLLMLLLLPLQLFIFQGTSIIALISNLFAIPIITLVALPSTLIASVLSCLEVNYLTFLFCFIANSSLEALNYILQIMTGYWVKMPATIYLLSFASWLLIILWRTGIWRKYYITAFLVLLILSSPLLKTKKEIWQLDMLDVGHGLAIVIRQGDSAILYDTGAKWNTSSAAERIIIPFLKLHNLTLEGIIISHEHDDHAGGLDVILSNYPEAWLMSSSLNYNNDYNCIQGQRITWGNLVIRSLWPESLSSKTLNPQSCVVFISDGTYSALLTGDLERTQEKLLVEKFNKTLFSTILQMPHHGSNTSSSYAFLANVNPEIVIASTSRYNPWHLPSNKVLDRYADLELKNLFTAYHGQISIKFYVNKWQIFSYRKQINSKWYHDWFGGLPKYR
ncbi:DNA internalization-related competence protein ComEC/Rec2 [Orbaceae bacterium ac157xtp]